MKKEEEFFKKFSSDEEAWVAKHATENKVVVKYTI